jgi:hypothetical protein
MTNKEVATSNNKGIAVAQGKMIPGLEGVEQDMLIIPRLKLVQKNSVEIDDKLAEPGEVVNSVTKDILAKGTKPVIIIPIKNNRTRILFRQFDDGGGLMCQSFDGLTGQGNPGGDCSKCPMNQWKVDDKKKNRAPDCTELLNIFCIVRGYDFPIPLTASFGRTSMGAGKQLINFFWADAQKAQKSPWNFAYQLKTEMTENEFGKFYVFKVSPEGMAEKDEIEKGELFYNLITSTQIQIHEDEDEIKAEQENIDKTAKADLEDKADMDDDNDDPFGPEEKK